MKKETLKLITKKMKKKMLRMKMMIMIMVMVMKKKVLVKNKNKKKKKKKEKNKNKKAISILCSFSTHNASEHLSSTHKCRAPFEPQNYPARDRNRI
jgi:hypothetical protein